MSSHEEHGREQANVCVYVDASVCMSVYVCVCSMCLVRGRHSGNLVHPFMRATYWMARHLATFPIRAQLLLPPLQTDGMQRTLLPPPSKIRDPANVNQPLQLPPLLLRSRLWCVVSCWIGSCCRLSSSPRHRPAQRPHSACATQTLKGANRLKRRVDDAMRLNLNNIAQHHGEACRALSPRPASRSPSKRCPWSSRSAKHTLLPSHR